MWDLFTKLPHKKLSSTANPNAPTVCMYTLLEDCKQPQIDKKKTITFMGSDKAARTTGPGGGWGVLGSGFAGYVPLASQNPHPIIVYSVPHPSHFWANVIVISRTEFNAS